jgi:uncharacterized protein YbjT (DUF2867 family)
LNVVVAGGHGQIAQHLLRRLAERGDGAFGLVRNPGHAPDLEALGARAIVCDLEEQENLAACVADADAVVFAAGAGPGSGPERKRSVDLGGAVKLVDAARVTGVERYLMVSSIGAGDPTAGDERMRPYLEAKAEADQVLAQSGLDFTIVRPGILTDEPGTGRVEAGGEVPRGEIPREDVAAVLLACLDAGEAAIGRTFTVIGGETPIEEALRSL